MQHYSFQKTFFFVSKDGQTNPFRVITLYYVNAAMARVKGFFKFIYKKSRSRPVEGKDKEIFSSGQNRAVGEGNIHPYGVVWIDEHGRQCVHYQLVGNSAEMLDWAEKNQHLPMEEIKDYWRKHSFTKIAP
jgi:hypothetical protein